MVLWYLQALLGNGAHLLDAVQGNQKDVEEQMIFFKLSLGGFKGWAQSDSVQTHQPWSKTAHGQECCKFFSFVRIKVFYRKGLRFWGFGGFVGVCLFVCFLELPNEFFFWFWLWLNNLLHCNLTAEFSVAALVVSQDKSSGPCYVHMTLFPVQTPWTSHDPYSSSISWRSRCSSLDQNRASLLESCWTQPCPRGGGSGKEQHPKTLSKTFSAKNTACASAGLSWAEEKPWTLSGIRWVVWSTFTGERRLKEQNPRASKPDTVHFQFKVHEIRETAYI